MSLEIHPDYGQSFLLPPSLDKWVPQNHPARFIREFVDSCDLADFGFKIRESESGRPNYSSELLLKIWLYGLFEKIYSSRDLEKACRNHMAFIWLTGMNYPDHNTIWRFYHNHRELVDKIFRHSVKIAISNDMVGFGIQALDGTKILADASVRNTMHKSTLNKLISMLEEPLEEILRKVDETELKERDNVEYFLPKKFENKENLQKVIKEGVRGLSKDEKEDLKDYLKGQVAKLEEAGTNHINLTDEDSRLMISKKSRTEFQFNAQAVVDDKKQIVVASSVTNDVVDQRQLNKMIDEAEENTGKKARLTVADGSYLSGEGLAKAEESGHSVLINAKIRNKKDKENNNSGKYSKLNFKYDRKNDIYICPEGGHLTYQRTFKRKKNSYTVRFYHCRNYKNCKFKEICSRNKRGRIIERTEHDDVLTRQRKKNELPAGKRLLARRKFIVEPVFGWIKRNYGFQRWSYRGLTSVNAQWNLMCCMVNLRKIYRKWKENEVVFC